MRTEERLIYIAELMSKRILGVLTEQERHELENWIDNNDARKKIMNKYEQGFAKIDFDPRKDQVEASAAYRRWLQQRPKPSSHKHRLLRLWGVAAGWVAVMGICYWLWESIIRPHSLSSEVEMYTTTTNLMDDQGRSKADAWLVMADGSRIPMQTTDSELVVTTQAIKQGKDLIALQDQPTNSTNYNILQISCGKQLKMQLSDGTKVWINSDSEITFPNHFEGELREVWVKGELLFDVAHDAKHPFIVHTEQGEIKVLGTIFNVHCYAEETPTVTLVSGKVRYLKGEQTVDLSPGQQCQVHADGLKVTEVDVYEYTAWANEVIVFRDKPLKDLMKMLSRLYSIQIIFEDEALKELPFSGAFKRYDRPAEILRMIEESGQIYIESRENQLILKRK